MFLASAHSPMSASTAKWSSAEAFLEFEYRHAWEYRLNSLSFYFSDFSLCNKRGIYIALTQSEGTCVAFSLRLNCWNWKATFTLSFHLEAYRLVFKTFSKLVLQRTIFWMKPFWKKKNKNQKHVFVLTAHNKNMTPTLFWNKTTLMPQNS